MQFIHLWELALDSLLDAFYLRCHASSYGISPKQMVDLNYHRLSLHYCKQNDKQSELVAQRDQGRYDTIYYKRYIAIAYGSYAEETMK